MKTLKDIQCIHVCNNRKERFCDACGIEEYHSIDENELRQEAIKWIKHWKEELKKLDEEYGDNGKNKCLYCGADIHDFCGCMDELDGKVEAFKEFFNIEDELIKEEEIK